MNNLEKYVLLLEERLEQKQMLSDLLGEQIQALVENNIQQIEEADVKLQQALVTAKQVDEKAAEVLLSLEKELSLVGDYGIEDIAKKAPNNIGEQLLKTQKEYNEVIADILEKQSHHKVLLKQGLEFVDSMISLMSEDTRSETYDKKGKARKNKNTLLKRDM